MYTLLKQHIVLLCAEYEYEYESAPIEEFLATTQPPQVLILQTPNFFPLPLPHQWMDNSRKATVRRSITMYYLYQYHINKQTS